MGWAILIIIGYTPVLYRMQRSINNLEKEVEKLRNSN